GVGKALHRFHATLWRGHVRLDDARIRLVPKRDADRDADGRLARHPREQIEIALDERRLRDDVHGISVIRAYLEARARELVRSFERLVTIGVAAEHDELAFPRLSLEGFAQKLGDARLHDDLALEVRAAAEP